MATERVKTVRAYYRTIDEDEYDDLATLLTPEFVHERPDRTLEGRDRFIRFMRDERPLTDTTHAVDDIYRDEDDVVVRGRLLRGNERLFGFVDVFSFTNGTVSQVRTYTR